MNIIVCQTAQKKEHREALELDPTYQDAQKRLEGSDSQQPRTGSIRPIKADDHKYLEITKEARDLEQDGQYEKALSKIEEALRDEPDCLGLLLYKRTLISKMDSPLPIETVIGYKELRAMIRRKVIIPVKFCEHQFFKNSPIARHFKGILLYGPPGCGKTLFVRSLAKEERFVFIELVLSDVPNMYVGESEKRLTAIFDKAKKTARSGKPVLLLIDEIEGLGLTRSIAPDPTESRFELSFKCRNYLSCYPRVIGTSDPRISVSNSCHRISDIYDHCRPFAERKAILWT